MCTASMEWDAALELATNCWHDGMADLPNAGDNPDPTELVQAPAEEISDGDAAAGADEAGLFEGDEGGGLF